MRRDREHAYQGQGQGQAGTVPTLFDQVLALAAGRPVFTADNVAVVGGKVVAFIDWNDPTHVLQQANTAQQVAAPAPHAGFGGALVATFVGGNWYQSNRPASAFAYTGDCVSFEAVRVFAPAIVNTNNFMDTTTGSLGFNGYQAMVGNTPGKHTVTVVSNGALGFSTAFGSAAIDAPTFSSVRVAAASTPQYALYDRGALAAQGSLGVVPTSTAPEWSLAWGLLSPVINFYGQFAALLHLPALTDAQRDIVHAWIKQAYGLRTTADLFAEVLTLSAGRPVFTADNYIEVAGKVVGFVDWNDPTHVLMQASSAAQVAVPLPHADFAGALCASFTGAQSYVSNRPTSQWVTEHDGVSSEVFFALSPTAASLAFFMATAANAGAAGFHLYNDSTYRHFLSNDSGGAVINTAPAGTPSVGVATYVDIRHRAADAAQYVIRHRGTLTAQDQYTAPPSPGPASIPCELGARNGALFSSMRWPALGFFPALDDAQRAIVQQWILQAYGIAA